MSGLLRRIKRSRAADAGETPAEEQAAGPGGAPTTGQASELPRPAIARDPDAPAGLEAAERPAAGRPGRLRRRLRYLRRAREVMLRDLGGLMYEVHRSGGGDYGAHANVIGSKVERLKSLDAETRAIEEALAAPRSETVVFQPGVGGTCDFCGEIYGSDARFCSHCGSPTGSAVRATPAPISRPLPLPKPLGERPAPAVAEESTPAAGESKPADEAPPEGVAPADQAAADKAPTEESEQAPPEAVAPAERAAVNETPTDESKPAGEAGADEPGSGGRNPFSRISNGRSEEDAAPPELSPGDPLATRESRS